MYRKEQWKDAVYYSYGSTIKFDLSDKLEVSSFGNVRWKPKKTGVGRPRKGSSPIIRKDTDAPNRPNCYETIMINVDGKLRRIRIGRLVLSTFAPRDDAGYYTTDHTDENIYNNRLSNLTWMSMKDNMQKRTKK